MNTSLVRAGLVVVLGSLALAPRAVANPYTGPDSSHVQFFGTPSGNIHCEINFQRAQIRDGAYCMSIEPLQNASIRSDGSFERVCTNDPVCGSNPPQDEPVLPYGQSAVLGPFTCLSEASGVTCTANGSGFAISPKGVVPVRN